MLNTILIAATVAFIFAGPVHAGAINKTFDMALDTEKTAICAPVLLKSATLFELSYRELLLKKSSTAERMSKPTFEIQYRAIVLQRMSEQTTPALNKHFWVLSGTDADLKTKDGLKIVVSKCIDFYNRMMASGRISMFMQTEAAKEANRLITEAVEEANRLNYEASVATANQECITGLIKTDLCAKARQLSDEIAVTLPMKMSQNMSWESIAAFGKTIQAQIRLSYDKKHLEEIFQKAGRPLSHAKQAIQKSAASICQQDAPTKAFISLGGSFNIVYSFVDGEQFTTAVVSSCK